MVQDDYYEILPSEIHYDPTDVIGMGTFGTVYKGMCRGMVVAVKVPHKQHLNDDELAKFIKGVKTILSYNSYPHLVHFVGACTVPGAIQIVTELCKCNLTTYLQKPSSIDRNSVLLLAWDIAVGLSLISHTHLKPANILIDFDNQIKISDWELDVFRNSKPVWGPHIWMSPEVAKSELRSTVYSFGLVFWYMLTQEMPYQHWNNMQQFTDAVYHNHEHPPFEPQHNIPKPFQTFIETCWDPECKVRPYGLHVEISKMWWDTKFITSFTVEAPEEVEWTTFQQALASDMNIQAQQLDILHSLLEQHRLIEEKDVYVISKSYFADLVSWFGLFYISSKRGNDILEQMLLLPLQPWFHGYISRDEFGASRGWSRGYSRKDYEAGTRFNRTDANFFICMVGKTSPMNQRAKYGKWIEFEYGRDFDINRLKEHIINQTTKSAVLNSFWLRNYCRGSEFRELVSWTELQATLAHELQLPEEQLEIFCSLFADKEEINGTEVLCVTIDRFTQLVGWYGHFFDPVCGKELLEQVTLLHSQLWFYKSMTVEETDAHLFQFSKQTFVVRFGEFEPKLQYSTFSLPKPFAVSSPNNHQDLDRKDGVLRGNDGGLYRTMVDCVELSFPPARLTYVCRETGRLAQLPIKRAWEKLIMKFENWKNNEQLSDFTGIHDLQGKLITEVECITALANICNLATRVMDCKLPQRAYKFLMSAWLHASLHQVVNASCAVFNFETTLGDHLVKILSQVAKVVTEILSYNTKNLKVHCPEIAEEVRQAIELAAVVEQNFDGILKLIRELLDAIENAVLNEEDHAQVAITACLEAVTKVREQWRITVDSLEALKGDNAILLLQHEALTIDTIRELAFSMNKSNAQLFAIALCQRLSGDHLYLILPLLDDMLATSDTPTHAKLENELKEKLSYYSHEAETLVSNIEQAMQETLNNN